MKNLYFESITTLKFDAPVVDHHFLLRYLPATYGGQRIASATLVLTPGVAYTLSCDGFGNLNQTGCIKFPHREFSYAVSGRAVICEAERQRERLYALYKYPSNLTHTNEEMLDFVESLHLKGSVLSRAMHLSDAVSHMVAYTPGITNIGTTAAEVFALRKGVCQDFAHLYIALARLAGITARYANGLPVGEGQSHAWTEVYVDGMWVGVDPTRNRMVGEDYVRFCVGRDFGDCALERGVLFGNAHQTQSSITRVVEQ